MRSALVGLLAVVGCLVVASPASAATCSEYSTQAEAQRAADTRDGDGDGVYCETLPCPCVKPGSSGGGANRPRQPNSRPRTQVIHARISRVVDGDTITVRAFGATRRFYTVRLIGIDTPETKRPGTPVQCGGKAGTSYMLTLAFTAPRDSDHDGLFDVQGGVGRHVVLRTDPTQDVFDRYGRLLAYVTTRAGVLLQTRMLAAGWATTYVYRDKPFQRVRRFRSAERSARNAGGGVYERCGGNFHRPA